MWRQSNAQVYRVSLTAGSQCKNSNGMPLMKTYTLFLTVTCNTPGLAQSNIIFPMVTVNTTYSYTMRENMWGGNAGALNRSLTYGNATIEPTSVSCSLGQGLSNTGPLKGPSRFCGPSATTANGMGVPTVLFTSSEYGFRNAFFEVTGSYNTRCAVQSTFWQMTSMQCALPYVPTYTIVPPQPVACKPRVVAYWTVQQTPCGSCPAGSNGQTKPLCEFQQYRNFQKTRYQVPTTRDANNNAWSCVYSSNGRLANQQSTDWCTVAGVGLEGVDGTNARFTPMFPGTYKLNYTVVDGCNPPKVYPVTITARCITQAKMPVVPNAVTNYYCGGNPHSTASNAAGAFQSVDLWALSHKQINIVEGSSFQSPTPQDITGVCYVAPTIYTCTTLRSYFNNLNFGDFITSGASNPVNDQFKQCCNCLYSLTIINGGSSNNPTPPPSTPSSTPGTTSSPPGTTGSPNNGNGNSGSSSALTAEEAKRRRNENILIGLAAPLGVILIASMALNAYMVMKLRQGGPSTGGFNVEAGDVELSTSPSRHMDV